MYHTQKKSSLVTAIRSAILYYIMLYQLFYFTLIVCCKMILRCIDRPDRSHLLIDSFIIGHSAISCLIIQIMLL